MGHPLGSVVTSPEVSSQVVLSCRKGTGVCYLRGWDFLFSRVLISLGLQKAGEEGQKVCVWPAVVLRNRKPSGQPLVLPRPHRGGEGATGTCVPGTG